MSMEKKMTAREEPLSPVSQLFCNFGDDCINMVTFGSKSQPNPSLVVEGLKKTLVHHPRFSSILETGDGKRKGKGKWIPTQVKVEEHVIIPEIDPNIENPDQFLEDYTSNMIRTPMDKSKPLWEFHLLKLKTSHAESVAIARFHHCLGDGMSLMSLLLACTRKTSDPKALPTFAVASKKSDPIKACWFWSMVAWIWYMLRVLFHTCVEVFKAALFVCFGADKAAPLVSKSGAKVSPNKFIHRIVSLEDVKFVKNAMNMTVNDVLLGVVQAGLACYLSQRYDLEPTSKSRKSLQRLSLKGACFFNLRPNKNIEDLANMMAKGSKIRWGNTVGFVVLPLHMKSENDVFEYVRQAKATMDHKKLSLEPIFSYALVKFIMDIFGTKAVNAFVNRLLRSSTMLFSNVIGPTEEITFFDHQISYIAGTTMGMTQALMVNVVSYVDKVILNIGVDVAVISDPHHLCDLMAEALCKMKTIAAEKVAAEKISAEKVAAQKVAAEMINLDSQV